MRRICINDNIDELLAKIIEFTEARQKILVDNIKNANKQGFSPRDLPVEEFAGAIDGAIIEHTKAERLLLCDTENIKFGPKGTFITAVVYDEKTKQLFEENIDDYLKLEGRKLAENRLNNIVASRLLSQKQAAAPALSNY